VSVRFKDDTSKSQISALAYVVLQGQGVTDPGTQVVRVLRGGWRGLWSREEGHSQRDRSMADNRVVAYCDRKPGSTGEEIRRGRLSVWYMSPEHSHI
jgi:hypothetical protein